MKLSLLSLSLITPTLALPSHRIPDLLSKIKRSQEPLVSLTAEFDEQDVQTLRYTQKLNHFDDDSTDTFLQRYFYTNRYVHANKSEELKTVAFLCVGGEGPSLDTSVLINSVHCTGDMIELAHRLFDNGWDVHLFALEHRYYGESFPVLQDEDTEEEEDDNSSETSVFDYSNLTHLSSRQAIQDIISFVQSSQVQTHLSQKQVKWITFGGSYPGMLSAWSRLLHPTVIHGAVSNSAPIQPELDFIQYSQHAGWDLADATIGGSEMCRVIFIEGHEEIVNALEGRSFPDLEEVDDSSDVVQYIANLFNVCDGPEVLKVKRNVELFVGDGVLRVPAQENDPSCDGEVCNIEKLCTAITDEYESNPNQSSMQILAKINQLANGNDCQYVEWSEYLDYYSNPTPLNANDRSWIYQTCTEFGFYQTCPHESDCPYAKGYHTVDRDLELCQKTFDIDPNDVPKSIQSTLEYYGGWNLTPSLEAMGSIPSSGPHLYGSQDEQRILFVNGDVDPWSELAMSKVQNPKVRSVTGASHHFWTHKVQESDGEAVVEAREGIYETVSSWLGIDPLFVTAVE